MPYRPYPPATPALVVRDPVVDLPADHLAHLVDQLVEAVVHPAVRPPSRGQPPYDPRLCLKVLIYAYATGVRSSRRMEQLCEESLPYLLLTRGDTPSYRTLCTARLEQSDALEQVFAALYAVAAQLGLKRLGHLVLDSTKLRANASPEAVLRAKEFAAVRAELERLLKEARRVDERESREGQRATLRLGQAVSTPKMREIVRRVRRARRQEKRAGSPPAATTPAARLASSEPSTAPQGGAPPRGRSGNS